MMLLLHGLKEEMKNRRAAVVFPGLALPNACEVS